jgi:hypothetical protein
VDFDTSELFLYKNMVIEDSGNLKEALHNLEEVEKKNLVLDKIHAKEKRGKKPKGFPDLTGSS